jgi:hypothetical protein
MALSFDRNQYNLAGLYYANINMCKFHLPFLILRVTSLNDPIEHVRISSGPFEILMKRVIHSFMLMSITKYKLHLL